MRVWLPTGVWLKLPAVQQLRSLDWLLDRVSRSVTSFSFWLSLPVLGSLSLFLSSCVCFCARLYMCTASSFLNVSSTVLALLSVAFFPPKKASIFFFCGSHFCVFFSRYGCILPGVIQLAIMLVMQCTCSHNQVWAYWVVASTISIASTNYWKLDEHESVFESLPAFSPFTNSCPMLLLWFNAAVICGDPGQASNSVRTGSYFRYPNAVSFTCVLGYRLVGQSRLTCTALGRWSSSLPKCERIMCPSLNTPAHAVQTGKDRYLGSHLSFSCPAGFTLSGSSILICSSSGKWTADPPLCIPVQCPVLSTPVSAVVVSRNNTYRGYTIFACSTGYVRDSGDASRQCKSNRVWSGVTLVCIGEKNSWWIVALE